MRRQRGDEERRRDNGRRRQGRAHPAAVGLLALFSFLSVFVVAEIALRFFWHNPYEGEREHVLVLRKISPNTTRHYSRALVDHDDAIVTMRTGPHSYILPTFRHEEPELTIAFLGGSTTECAAVLEELRFPALVATQLSERGLRTNTLNAARSGNTTQDSLNLLLNFVVNDRPDIAVMMHVTNDIGVLSGAKSYTSRQGHPLSAGDLTRWTKHAASNYSYLVGFARHSLSGMEFRNASLNEGVEQRDIPRKSDTIPIDLYRERVRAFASLSRGFGIRPVLMTQPLSISTNELTPAWHDLGAQDRFNEVIRQVGLELDVPVIDLARHLVQNVPKWNEPGVVFYDGMHVNDRGSRIYADHITDRLLAIVGE